MGWENRDYHRSAPSGFAGGGLSRGSVVTWLLGINCVVFMLDMVLGGSQRASVIAPFSWGAFTVDQAVWGGQLWRWGTYQFLHAGFLHLLMNMIGLYFFGPMLERWWGSRRFLVFYLLCGTSGAVLFSLLVLGMPQLIFPPDALPWAGLAPLVGASGSLFGILAGAAIIAPHTRVMLLFPPIPMKLRTMACLFLGIAALSVIAGGRNAGGDAAHLGGAALGALLVCKPRWLDWADRWAPDAVMRGAGRGRFEKKQRQAAARQAAERAEIDRILDKVRAQGLQSLTGKEKKALARETDRQRRGA